MDKLPVLSGKEIVKILTKQFGFSVKRQKGSHVLLIKEVGKKVGVVVPLHKEIKKGTLVSILKQAGISREEFIDSIK